MKIVYFIDRVKGSFIQYTSSDNQVLSFNFLVYMVHFVAGILFYFYSWYLLSCSLYLYNSTVVLSALVSITFLAFRLILFSIAVSIITLKIYV